MIAGLGHFVACLLLGSRVAIPVAAPDTQTVAYDASGVRVIQRINRSSDVVTVHVYLLGGTRQLMAPTAGIESLLLHASAHGSAHYPGDEAELAMARTGSRVFISADADWTVFGFVGLSAEFATSWRVLADRLAAPTLGADAVERARSRMLGAARRRYTDPDERIRLLANQSRFADHPYALDPDGTEQSLPTITASQLTTYHQTQIVKSRLLVVVAGNVERETAEPLIAETLGPLPPGAYRWTPPPPAPEQQSRWLVEPRQLPTNYILGYFTGPPPQSHDYPAFMMATYLLSGAVNSAVRQERSLSYASYAPLIEQAIPVGGVYASTASPGEVLRILMAKIDELRGLRLSQFYLSSLEDRLSVESLLHMGTNAEQADLLARAELYFGDYRRAGPNMERLRGVTSQDLAVVTQRYLQSISFAFIGDTSKMRGEW